MRGAEVAGGEGLADDELIEAPEPSGQPPIAEIASGSVEGWLVSDDHGVIEALRRGDPALGAVEVKPLSIDGRVSARFYSSAEITVGPLLVWAHGGAFLGGDLDMAEAHWVGLSLARSGVDVLSVDYRKAVHGVCYPAPIEDLLQAWRWAIATAAERGTDTVHIGGASAGGSLAASAGLRLRDEAADQPASVVLAYPTLHRRLPLWRAGELDVIRDRAGDGYFSARWVEDMGSNYLGDGGTDHGKYAFPGDVEVDGMPAHLVLLAEFDTLRSSGEVYVNALRQSGTEVTRVLVPDSTHGFLNEPASEAGATALLAMARWIEERP